ncbi:tRNA glutamyl-Q(34) synthetase GluQRS [soil metagenome]
MAYDASAGAGRFAPSPTGSLHLGNLRTALLAWLFARSSGARFVVRMEDIDRDRFRAGIEEEQLADLSALGLDWDGPVVRQTERFGVYEEAISRLDADGLLYPCYCSRREIREAISAPHGAPVSKHYPGTCRTLTAARRAELEAAERSPSLRVRAEGLTASFEDRMLGYREGGSDDFVIRRNDGSPAYQLTVVVDDAEQGIDEVVRGDDLADSTPRQIILHRMLGLPEPRYAHVPLVFGPDGERLAKRHGGITLAERLDAGETPEAVLGWMARTLGLAEPGESVTARDLISRFDPELLPREPAIWSPEV